MTDLGKSESKMSDALFEVGLGRHEPGRKRARAYGHDIFTDKDGTTRYCDDLSVFDKNNVRPCKRCGADPIETDGHDPCIANLPGVRNACCGHGVDDPYIEFNDGRVVGKFQLARRIA